MDARQLAEWTLATLAPAAGWSCVVLTFVVPDPNANVCTHPALERRLRASSRCPECRRAVTLVGVPIEPRNSTRDSQAARVEALAARLASTDFRVGHYVLDASRVLLGPLRTSRYVAGGEQNYFWSFVTPGA